MLGGRKAGNFRKVLPPEGLLRWWKEVPAYSPLGCGARAVGVEGSSPRRGKQQFPASRRGKLLQEQRSATCLLKASPAKNNQTRNYFRIQY